MIPASRGMSYGDSRPHGGGPSTSSRCRSHTTTSNSRSSHYDGDSRAMVVRPSSNSGSAYFNNHGTIPERNSMVQVWTRNTSQAMSNRGGSRSSHYGGSSSSRSSSATMAGPHRTRPSGMSTIFEDDDYASTRRTLRPIDATHLRVDEVDSRYRSSSRGPSHDLVPTSTSSLPHLIPFPSRSSRVQDDQMRRELDLQRAYQAGHNAGRRGEGCGREVGSHAGRLGLVVQEVSIVVVNIRI